MAYFIGKSYVDRLVARLSLSLTKGRTGQFILSPMVVPTTNADDLLRTVNVVALAAVDPTAGTAYFTLFTVPAGKRWLLHQVQVDKAAGATITFAGIVISRPSPASTSNIHTQAAATSEFTVCSHALPMDAGDRVRAYVSGYTAGDTLTANIIYEEEDAY